MEEYKYPFNLVTEYVIKTYGIDTKRPYTLEIIPARELIVPERIDLMAKWFYIDAYVRGLNREDAIELYAAHLDAFSRGSFVEPGKEYKNSLQQYIGSFDRLIEDMCDNGFDEKKSIIPVGGNGAILDGAHRVAIAAYFDQKVTVIRFTEIQQNFGTDFFRANLLNSKYLKLMVDQYLKLKENCYFACLWPISYDTTDIDAVKAIIKEYGKIIYIQDVVLNYNGLKNFMSQIYGHQSWVGSYVNQFSGVDTKAKPCFAKGKPVKTIIFSAESLEHALEIKEKIRNLYNLEKHSIHISDSIDESRQMSELLYNINSVHHLNYGQPCAYKTVHNRMAEFKKLINMKGMEPTRFIIDAGSILEIYGLRQSRDMDYLTDYIEEKLPQSAEVDNHIAEMIYYNCSIKDLLYNPNNYFVYSELKFVALPRLLELKNNRNEKKDRRDARLIRSSLKKEYSNIFDKEEKILKYERKSDLYGYGLLSKKGYLVYRMRLILNRLLGK